MDKGVELCGMRNGLDERIDEGVQRWFCHVERMERDRIAKRVYIGGSEGRVRRRWIVTVKTCLKKEGWVPDKQEGWSRIGGNGGGL